MRRIFAILVALELQRIVPLQRRSQLPSATVLVVVVAAVVGGMVGIVIGAVVLFFCIK